MKKNCDAFPFVRRLGVVLFLIFSVQAPASANDSECITMRDNSLFNQCEFDVDVSFCVENPRQTKHFYDSSEAFRCPNGGLSTLGPGKKEGNILNGRVHWFACATKYRGKGGSRRYVEGSGYKGRCFSENASDSAPIQAPRGTAIASAAECTALENRMRPPGLLTTYEMRRADALTAIEYLDRSCGNLTPQQRADARKMQHGFYLDAVAECKRAGGKKCDAQDNPNASAAVQRPPIPSSNTPAMKEPARGAPSAEMLVSRCQPEIKAATDAFYAAQEEAARLYRSRGGMPYSDWQKDQLERAMQEAWLVLTWTPTELRDAHTQALREAAARANGYANDKSRHDPHHEAALLRACIRKARIDAM